MLNSPSLRRVGALLVLVLGVTTTLYATLGWLLLTGAKKDLYRLARNSFLITATDGDGGPDDFIHSELLILIDKEKRIRGFYNGTLPAEVDQLIKDINRLRKEY